MNRKLDQGFEIWKAVTARCVPFTIISNQYISVFKYASLIMISLRLKASIERAKDILSKVGEHKPLSSDDKYTLGTWLSTVDAFANVPRMELMECKYHHITYKIEEIIFGKDVR